MGDPAVPGHVRNAPFEVLNPVHQCAVHSVEIDESAEILFTQGVTDVGAARM